MSRVLGCLLRLDFGLTGDFSSEGLSAQYFKTLVPRSIKGYDRWDKRAEQIGT